MLNPISPSPHRTCFPAEHTGHMHVVDTFIRERMPDEAFIAAQGMLYGAFTYIASMPLAATMQKETCMSSKLQLQLQLQ